MGNIQGKNAAGTAEYWVSTRAGSDVEPHYSQESVLNAITALTALLPAARGPQGVSGSLSVTQATSGSWAVTGPLTDAQLRATAVTVAGTVNLGTISTAATAANQSTLIGHVDGIETLLTAVSNSVDGLEGFTDGIEAAVSSLALESGGNLAGIRTDLGTDGLTPPTLPGGSTGVRGWLRYLASLLPSLASGRWPVDGSGVTQPVSGTVTANIGTIGTAATAANQSTMIGHVDGIEGLLTTISGNVDGLEGFTDGVEASLSSIDTKASALALETTQLAQSALYGAVTETAPSTDTATSGLNGRLQRIAQRLTSLIALIPNNLTVTSTRLLVDGSGVTQPVSGTVAATQSSNWSMRLQDGAGNAITSATRGSERAMSVQLVDGAGGQVTSFGGGTQYAIDSVAGGTDTGTASLVVRRDTPTTLAPGDGDYTRQFTDRMGHLWVRPRLGLSYAAELVVTTSAYSAGQTMVAPVTITNAVNIAGDQLVLDSVVFTVSTAITPAFNLEFFSDTVTLGAANAAWNISAADLRRNRGTVQFLASDWINDGTPSKAQRHNLGLAMTTAGTSLIFALKATGAVTFAATTHLHVCMEFRRL